MTKEQREVVIAREQAVFWLDSRGYWHNKHGKFRHKKIIDFFHAAIEKDQHGYYLCQTRGDVREKVYFRYEDTALFVFDVLLGNEPVVTLNTRRKIRLDPKALRIGNDSLYMVVDGERIKFAERALVKIASLIEEAEGRYTIRLQGEKYRLESFAT